MYTYGKLLEDISYLALYGFETGSIGTSRYGRQIPWVKLRGGCDDCILVTGGIHAREHVSSLLVRKQLFKASVTRLPCNVYFVPMVNPDGNVLVSHGAEIFGSAGRKLIELNGGRRDFSLWKANAAGVDLNVNFDARWGEGKLNTRNRGSENFIGDRPFSEPESLALARFTEAVSPRLTVSYHAKGREIYYDFFQIGDIKERDRMIADYAAQITGYTLIEGTRGSVGGYKDWCIEKLGVPSLTVELADDGLTHPLSDSAIDEDFSRAPLLPMELYKYAVKKGLL